MIEEESGFLRAVVEPSWCIEVEDFDPSREADVESWFTVGNGRLGIRGSLEEGRPGSSPALFVAGVFGRAEGELWSLEPLPGPELTRLGVTIGGEVLDLGGEIVDQRRVLDLKRGILFRTWRQRLGPAGEITFSSARFASLADRALVVLQAEARLDGRPLSLAGTIPLPPTVGPVESVETSGDEDRVTGRIQGRDGGAIRFAAATSKKEGELERIAEIVPADRGGEGEQAELDPERGHSLSAEALRARHEAAWQERWSDSDVVVEGDPVAQRGLRFALYHLISAGDPETDRASIGARGLTGTGYKGHVFWDTDVFMVPFFIYTHPETARALLAYRYRTLPAARARARGFGCKGALFAWESADTGEDCTPPEIPGPDGTMIPVFTGEQEVHIAADVAWAVWEYWCATNDEEFLLEKGAEIVLETARFWASRVRPESEGRFHIEKVVGPDEYHEDVNDSAFTNAMARWNLQTALELAELLRGRHPSEWARLSKLAEIDEGELGAWRSVASGLVDQFDPDTLLYEQFSGFFDLDDVPVAGVAPRPFSGEAIFGWQRMRDAQIVKQADVVMMLHMLPENRSPENAEANYRYYEPRTTHGSSLSAAIYAAVAARAGLLDDAVTYFRMAADTDLGSRAGFSAKGVHMATAGGLWQAAVMGFGGFVQHRDHLALDPGLPAAWTRLRFPIRWRGAKVVVDLQPDRVTLTLDGPASIALGAGPVTRLEAARYMAIRADEGWSAWTR